jgi:hypothetical protein
MIENRRFAVSNRLPRRALLAGAGALALSDPRGGTAVAATSGLAVIGQDGWLFPLWDATSRFDQQQLRTTAQVMNEAIAALKAKGTEVVVAMVPSKARTYRQHLPGDVRLPADIDKRYPAALAEMRRPARWCRTSIRCSATSCGPNRRGNSISAPIPTGCRSAPRWPRSRSRSR